MTNETLKIEFLNGGFDGFLGLHFCFALHKLPANPQLSSFGTPSVALLHRCYYPFAVLKDNNSDAKGIL